MIDSIHQSTLNMALRCGEQFRRRYLENEIIPPSIAAGRGTGLHKANEVNLKQKIQTKEDLPVDDLKDAARDGYIHSFRYGVYLAKEDVSAKDKLLNDGLNQTIQLTELYHEEVAPEIVPLEVEQEFIIDVGLDLPLSGRIDMQEKNKVDDLKSSGKKWADGQIQKEIQPVFYSLAHEKQTGVRPEFVYHILRTLKDGAKRQVQSMTATDEQYMALFAKLQMFLKMLKGGLFPPANPTSWWCTPRYCGYFYTCPYVGNAKPKKWR